jgi:hypothetical protein
METREIKLTLDTATRWYNGNDAELKELALTTFPELGKKALPKSWEDLKKISGYFTDVGCDVEKSINAITGDYNKNIFATKEQAEASIALAQLSQLMKVYNDGWVVDWKNYNQSKHVIYFSEDLIFKGINNYNMRFLCFKNYETRDLFLENFRDLILTAKPLL